MERVKSDEQPRRSSLAIPKRQWELAKMFFIAQFIAVLGYQAALQIIALQYQTGPQDGKTSELLSDFMASSFYAMLVTAGTAGLLAVLIGLWASHRLYGPLPRIQQAFRKAIDGDRSVRLTLRPTDALGQIAEDFNSLVSSMEKLPTSDARAELQNVTDQLNLVISSLEEVERDASAPSSTHHQEDARDESPVIS